MHLTREIFDDKNHHSQTIEPANGQDLELKNGSSEIYERKVNESNNVWRKKDLSKNESARACLSYDEVDNRKSWPIPQIAVQEEELKQNPIKLPRNNHKSEKWIPITPIINHPPLSFQKTRYYDGSKQGRAQNKISEENYTARRYTRNNQTNGAAKENKVKKAISERPKMQISKHDKRDSDKMTLSQDLPKYSFQPKWVYNIPIGQIPYGFANGFANMPSNAFFNNSRNQDKPLVFNPTVPLAHSFEPIHPYNGEDLVYIKAHILSQIEYYFSIENLCKDIYLRKHMDENGFVALDFLSKFNRIKALNISKKYLSEVCANSQICELVTSDKHPSGEDMIRRRDGWQQWLISQSVFTKSPRDDESKRLQELDPKLEALALQP